MIERVIISYELVPVLFPVQCHIYTGVELPTIGGTTKMVRVVTTWTYDQNMNLRSITCTKEDA
jgi:hypothetical protein